MSAKKDYAGLRVGSLVAVRPVGASAGGALVWEWRCDCGGAREAVPANLLRDARKGGGASCRRCAYPKMGRAPAAPHRGDGARLREARIAARVSIDEAARAAGRCRYAWRWRERQERIPADAMSALLGAVERARRSADG